MFLSYEQEKKQYDWSTYSTKIFCCNTECEKKMYIVAVFVPIINAITLSTTTEKNIRQEGEAKVFYNIYVIFHNSWRKDRGQGAPNLASGKW
jgi:hypothetical protein